jgi:hypothetical protein
MMTLVRCGGESAEDTDQTIAHVWEPADAPIVADAPKLHAALSSLLNLWRQEARLNRAARMCRGDGRHARPGYDCPACDAAALLDK